MTASHADLERIVERNTNDIDALYELQDERRDALLHHARLLSAHSRLLGEHSALLVSHERVGTEQHESIDALDRRLADLSERIDAAGRRVDHVQEELRRVGGRPFQP